MPSYVISFSDYPTNPYPDTAHPPFHSHVQDEMLLILSGDVIGITSNTYLAHKGPCILFYKMNCPHTQINGGGIRYARYYLQFDRSVISPLYPDPSLLATFCHEDAFLLPLSETEVTRLCQAAEILREISLQPQEEDDPRAKLLISFLFAETTEIAKRQRLPVHTELYLTKVLQYISEHISQRLTIRDLSELFHVGKTKLTEDFRSYLSMSFSEYLTMDRLVRARAMLSRGMQVAQVAEQCGFTDSAYLIRVFKKRCGMTPAQYRRKFGDA